MKIIVVGSINVDMTVYSPRFPQDGETVLGVAQQTGTGGKGLNQATAASRSGSEVVFIGKVGTDFLSEIPMKHIKNESISAEYIKAVNGACTGFASIEVSTESGENRITVVKGANESLCEGDVYAAEPEFSSCGAVLAQLEIPDEAVLAAKALAKKYNKPFILNPAPMRKIPDGLFDGVDILTPNETEAAFFAGCDVEDYKKSADTLLAMGAKNVIVTLGKKGSYIKGAGIEKIIDAIPQKAVDTTGAGDAYNGGLATAVAEKQPLDSAVLFATKTASISVTRKGAANSMPTRAEIEAL